MDAKQALGSVIRDVRNQQALTQAEVAERGGLSLDYLRDLERARKQPTITYIFKVAKGLRIEPHILIKHVEEELAKSQPDSA